MNMKSRRILRYVVSAGFFAIGVLHFARPSGFIKIVPDYLSHAKALVAISGFFEILGAIGLLLPSVRKPAALGLIALLVAVFPANIYMAFEPDKVHGYDIPVVYFYLRLLLQPLFIYWVWIVGVSREKGEVESSSEVR
jgi:uncharacterized membrane protein